MSGGGRGGRRAPVGDSVRTVLGVSCDFHDAAAALVVDGRVLAASEQERFSRRKHDPDLPAAAIEACLRTAGCHADEVDVVSFYERPLNVLTRYLASRRRQGPAGYPSFVRDAPQLVGPNLMVSYRIDRELRRLGATSSPAFTYVDHHRSHAAAAFFPSPFRRAAVLTVDGIGEWATATVSRGVGERLETHEELRYPNSLGLVYSFVTSYCGFRPNEDEFKLMGLAPYGRARFAGALEELATVHEDGSVQVDARAVAWFGARGLRRRELHRLLGGPPTPPGHDPTQRDADLAASVQQLLETSLLRLVAHARDRTGEDDLCLGGGVAYNCVANGRILREGGVSSLWIQPAAGDAGAAIGAALSAWHEWIGRPRTVGATSDGMCGALLGPGATPEEVGRWVRGTGVPHDSISDERGLCDVVARRLADGDVVGWFQGRMEFGPRALGNRSILADPRVARNRSRINDAVKGRESFRPFAPAVLEERAADWFELSGPSPYMLLVAQVRGAVGDDAIGEPFERRADSVTSPIPACTHVDGSARVQTVDRSSNPRFRALLEAFERQTGCPVLLNTSFNVAGEPIVATPDDALVTARAAGLDLLVVGDVLIEGSALG